MKEGAKVRIRRVRSAVEFLIDEPADRIHFSPEESIALARALVRNAMDAKPLIVLPSDLGPALPRRDGLTPTLPFSHRLVKK